MGLCECCNVFDQGIRCFISHIHKSGNNAADVLARMGSKGISLIEFIRGWCEFGCFKFCCILSLLILNNKIVL